MPERYSPIQRFYDRKVAFVTGATGLVGITLVEKLLRSCSGIKRIYVLIRERSGRSYEKRFNEFLSSSVSMVFEKIPNDVLKKIVLIKGDLSKPQVGLSDADVELLAQEVNCIFHVGATVKFMDPLSSALKINVLGTHELLTLAKKIQNLSAFIYVSTTYSNCVLDTSEEKIYNFGINCEEMINHILTMDNRDLNEMQSTIIGKFPNTYTFSKHVSEHFVDLAKKDLPVAIVRSSIVMNTWKEPIPGWTTRFHSLNHFINAYNLGMSHVFYSNPNHTQDFIPLDYLTNNVIAVAWDVATNVTQDKTIRIYHSASSSQNPLTFGRFEHLLKKYDKQFPSMHKIWHRWVIFSRSMLLLRLVYFLQLLQMYSIDFFNFLSGSPKRIVPIYKRLHHILYLTTYFTKRSWHFENKNTQKLWDSLDEEDKKLFEFDATKIDWNLLFSTATLGIREHVLVDPIDTIQKAHARSQRLKQLHYFSIFSLFAILLFVINVFIN
ncbi:hypothetical protein FQA39_LY12552 [Lamprigera yunnana]|nr:hypothetical protein FQA39_LY12552 [Lamprigera yunnana]